jgi:GNAT superfamily N-acetyltransferase
MTVAIRALELSDRAIWDDLWGQYQVFYKTKIGAETSDVTFKRLLDSSVPMNGLVAEVDGKVVGIVHYIFHYSTWTVGPYCYLQDLFTSAEARGRGVATKLIEAVYEKAQAHGAARVYWLTHETNDVAIKLYEKVADKSGFIQFRKMMPVS